MYASKRKPSGETSLRFKMSNALKKANYVRLAKFLDANRNATIELFQGVDFGFVSVGPVMIGAEGFGYRISAEILLEQPIGFEVMDSLMFNDDMRSCVSVNRENLRLSKTVTEKIDLENDLNIILQTAQRIVNHVCDRIDTLIEQTVVLNSEWLDRQLDTMIEREELEKRGESARPFGTIHAKGSREAKERAGELIPLYKGHDKTYLYDAKREYFLLPHDFVADLLRCNKATMVMEEEFDKRGKDVLRDLVYKKYLRKHEMMDGTVCYYYLSEKIRRYLTSHLEHRTSRL